MFYKYNQSTQIIIFFVKLKGPTENMNAEADLFGFRLKDERARFIQLDGTCCDLLISCFPTDFASMYVCVCVSVCFLLY